MDATRFVSGQAGASARRRYERSGQRSWGVGADGEEEVGAELARAFCPPDHIVLHDRRMPAETGNIDHIVVAPNGVFVIDAKRYSGDIELRSGDRLFIDGHDRTALVLGVRKQCAAVATALIGHRDGRVPIHPMLWFVSGRFTQLQAPRIDGVSAVWSRIAVDRIAEPGIWKSAAVRRIADHLHRRLPPVVAR